MSPIVLSKEKRRQTQNKTKVLCHPLFYLKKKEEDNNTKTKQKFYVTHCFI